MKKSDKVIVGGMIVVILIMFGVLWFAKDDGKTVLDGLDPGSYNISTTCTQVDGNKLICNDGKDVYLVVEGANVYVQIKEKNTSGGDSKYKYIYHKADSSDIKEAIKNNNVVNLHLWMNANSKIRNIIIVQENIK